MKIAVLGDTHFGMRNDSHHFHDYYRAFYQDVFFPYLTDNNIKVVVQTGDMFDRRKFVNFNSLHLAKGYFFDEFVKRDIKMYTYVGNHDIYYKNTLKVNSIELLLQDYIDKKHITVFTEPSTITLDNTAIDIIPWICQDNEAQCKAFISNTTSQICFGHFEISGFSMEKGFVCVDGMNRQDLARYEIVISGHFHHRSTDGHINYVGSPGEMTWADHEDQRGFHVFDTDTRELTFIKNPYNMFFKIPYNDTEETLDSVAQKDFSGLANTYVKVIVQAKTNAVLFDKFMIKIYEQHPIDVNIIEDFSEYNSLSSLMDDGVDQSDDTTTILDKYIDGVEFGGVDKDKLKNIMRNVYNEAHSMEI